MDLAIKAWVFNPDLEGKFVVVLGIDEEGDKICVSGKVDSTNGDFIEIREATCWDGKCKLHKFCLREFNDEGLSLEVYDQAPSKCEKSRAHLNEESECDARRLLREARYEENLLATMTDEDCEAEVQELPYNA